MDEVEAGPGVTAHHVRTAAVIGVIEELGCECVLDLGCGSGELLKRLRFVPSVTSALGVDCNEAELEKCRLTVAPTHTDFLSPRSRPLAVKLYHGSFLHTHPELHGCDVATSVEVVEHLLPDDLPQFATTLFGLIGPPTVVLTTPNQEFNEVMGMRPGEMRHWDHKFEWTRAEFRHWCDSICRDYPYTVAVSGVGRADCDAGSITQMAIFSRMSGVPESDTPEPSGAALREVYTVEYPVLEFPATFNNINTALSELAHVYNEWERGWDTGEYVIEWQSEWGRGGCDKCVTNTTVRAWMPLTRVLAKEQLCLYDLGREFADKSDGSSSLEFEVECASCQTVHPMPEAVARALCKSEFKWELALCFGELCCALPEICDLQDENVV